MRMTLITRRGLMAGGATLGAMAALGGSGLLDWAKAWAQTAPWTPEKGAELSLLRWKYFVQSEDDAFVALIDAFTKATGVKVTISRESYEDVQYRGGPGYLLGLIFAAASVPAEGARRHRCRRISRHEIWRLGRVGAEIRQDRQQMDRHPDLL
jgi:hypothetical protein